MEMFTRKKVTGFGAVPKAGVSSFPQWTCSSLLQRCVELSRPGCCVSLILLPDQLAGTCWKGAKAPFFVANVTIEHGNIRRSTDSLVSLGSAVAVLVSCVEGELQSSALPTLHLSCEVHTTWPWVWASIIFSLPGKLMIQWEMWEIKKFRLKQGAIKL